MKLFQTSKDNLDEVVFENRNKLYGAYAMRKDYDANLAKATASSFSLLLLFFSAVYVSYLFKPEIDPVPAPGAGRAIQVDGTKVLTKIKIVTDEFFAAAAASADNLNYKIVADEKLNKPKQPDPEPAQNNNNTGSNPQGGNPDQSGGGPVGTPGGTGNDPGNGEPKEPEPKEPEVIPTWVSEMPSFPGGLDKLREYFENNLKYPNNARELGIEGKVVVTFVVTASGEITNIKLQKTIGYGCDDEAVRVVGEMPGWNPGKQAGKRVPVQMILPVVFKLH